MRITLIKDVLTDDSETFSLEIQNNGQETIIEIAAKTESDAGVAVNSLHDALEAATGDHVEWADMLTRNAGW